MALLFKRIKNHIDENYAKIQSISEIADEFGISLSYLTRVFRNNIGVGPKEYLDHVRIKTAVKLLQQKKLRCYEISESIGLKDEDALVPEKSNSAIFGQDIFGICDLEFGISGLSGLGKLFKRRGLPAPSILLDD